MSERYAIYPPCRIGQRVFAVLDMELPITIEEREVCGIAYLNGEWLVADKYGTWFEYGSWAVLPTREAAEKMKEELEAAIL